MAALVGRGWAMLGRGARWVRDRAFGLFLILVFLSPSLQNGPWTWWRVVTLPWFGDKTRSLGLLALVPALLVGLWAITLVRDWRTRRWRWGNAHFTVPLALYSALVLISLRLTPSAAWWTQLALLAALWLTYFYVINERPALKWVWVVIVLAQGVVAIGQYALQREIGLQVWGEPILNPLNEGTSVFMVNGAVYLRAYGLTFHPNALGALLAVLLLCLVATPPMRGWQWGVVAVGIGGLMFSFSRSGLLAFAVGAAVWGIHQSRRVGWHTTLKTGLRLSPVVAIVVVLALPYRDFATSRWLELNNPLELRSLYERGRDARIAVELMAQNPLGVGVTHYAAAARAIDSNALIVHDAFLLTGVEIGWMGVACMLWFTGAGVVAHRSPYQPVWVAWVVAALFDVVLWITTGLRGAVMVGLLLGMVQAGNEKREMGNGK